MKILIITAHPSSKGFTHRIANAYKEGRESSGHTVEVLDLYKTDLQQGFLKYEERSDMGNPDPIRDAMHAKILASDELVFVHPMWWVSPPAIMKNFIDVNISARFAFKYVNGKPVGLLKGKIASVFITCDGSLWLYRLIAMPFKTIWKYGILGLCGLKVVNFKVFDKKFKKTEVEQVTFLANIKRLGQRG